MQMFSDKTLGKWLGSDWLSSGCREKMADYSSRSFGLQILSTPCSDPTPWNFYPKSTLPQIPSNFLISATHGMRSHTLCIFNKCSSAWPMDFVRVWTTSPLLSESQLGLPARPAASGKWLAEDQVLQTSQKVILTPRENTGVFKQALKVKLFEASCVHFDQ